MFETRLGGFGWFPPSFINTKDWRCHFPAVRETFTFHILLFPTPYSCYFFIFLFPTPYSSTRFFHLCQNVIQNQQKTILVLFMNWKLESLMHPANSVETFLLQKRNWRCIVTISRYFSFLKISSLLVLCRNWKVERESPFEVWCIPPASCKFRAKFLA